LTRAVKFDEANLFLDYISHPKAHKKTSATILLGGNMRLAHLYTLNSGLLSTLSDVSNTYHVPFIRSITGITLMILETIQVISLHDPLFVFFSHSASPLRLTRANA
jgi:hypothetical protein